MGLLCSCCATEVLDSRAFRTDLGTSLLDKNQHKLPNTTKVFSIKLQKLENIIVGDSSTFVNTSNSYVELRLLPPGDQYLGVQKQLSSIKPNTLFPKWEPPELFHFIASEPASTKILLSAYHYNDKNPSKSVPLGDAVIQTKDFADKGSETMRTVELVSPSTGTPQGTASITIKCLSLEEAMRSEEQIAYEFQRYSPVLDWGSTPFPGHFLQIDPKGHWCTADGKIFSDELADLFPLVRDDQFIAEGWHTLATDEDPDGWQYGFNFNTPYWYPSNENNFGLKLSVRRRQWFRVLENKNKGAYRDSSTSLSSSHLSMASEDSTGKTRRRKKLFR